MKSLNMNMKSTNVLYRIQEKMGMCCTLVLTSPTVFDPIQVVMCPNSVFAGANIGFMENKIPHGNHSIEVGK